MGAEDIAGRALIVAAGKSRGHSLADVLKGLKPDEDAVITAKLSGVLGADGTRLCLVNQIKQTELGYEVHITESACASGVVADAPICAFTLGVFIGAMEVVTGKRIYGQEVSCVGFGNDECFYNLEILV